MNFLQSTCAVATLTVISTACFAMAKTESETTTNQVPVWDNEINQLPNIERTITANHSTHPIVSLEDLHKTTPAGGTEMNLSTLAMGWHAIFMTNMEDPNHIPRNSNSSLTLTDIPVPAAIYLFVSALAGLLASKRKK